MSKHTIANSDDLAHEIALTVKAYRIKHPATGERMIKLALEKLLQAASNP